MCRDRYTGLATVVLVLIGLAWAAPVGAQETKPGRDLPPGAAQPPPERLPQQADPEPYPAGPQLHRDFAFPDPDRPFGRGRYLDPYRSGYPYGGPRSVYPRGYYRDDRGRNYRRYYYDDYTYRFGVPDGGDPYAGDLERAYRQGIADGQNYERFEIQAERGLAAYQRAIRAGHRTFEAGEYGLSARQFLLAATLNQNDAVSRICAAHAEVALGQYEPAGRLLRRAFELQPKIAYLPLDIRGSYGKPGDFAKHEHALEAAAKKDSDNADVWFLLGYYFFYSDNTARAAEAFAHAAKLSPQDPLFARLAEIAGMSVKPPGRASGGR